MRFLLATALAVAAVSAWGASAADAEQPPKLDCTVGPLHKTYGQTDWLVYACSDARSVVVVSDEGNPSLPFYFILYVQPDGAMHVYGEGTGDQNATKAAFDEIQTLTPSDVAGLVEQARDIQLGGATK